MLARIKTEEILKWSGGLGLSRRILANAILGRGSVDYAFDLYKACHLATNPFGPTGENGNKYSFNDYFFEYANLIRSMQQHGFDERHPIVINSDNLIVDGLHRVGAASALGIEDLPVEYGHQNSQTFTPKALNGNGLSETFALSLAYEYITNSQHAKILIHFSSDRRKHNLISRELSKDTSCQTVMDFHFPAGKEAINQLLYLAYGHNEWYDSLSQNELDRFRGERLIDHTGEVSVFVFDSTKPSAVDLKIRLRASLRGFERNLHGTDEWFEAVRFGPLFSGFRSQFLAWGSPSQSYRGLAKIDVIRSNSIAKERLQASTTLSGSAILEIMGLRMAKDIDVIAAHNEASDLGESHSDYLRSMGLSPLSLMGHSSSTFWWEGYAVLTPYGCLGNKVRADEEKSTQDIGLLGSLIWAGSVGVTGSSMSKRAGVSTQLRIRIRLSRSYEKLLLLFPASLREPLRRMARRAYQRVCLREN